MSSPALSPGAALRAKLNERRALIVPGCADALAARVIESQGFEAVYLSGAGLTNAFYGLPDLGFINLGDVARSTAAVRDAVALPLIVDADTGFGNALNVRQTIRTLERAGANAVQIEDQVQPKRCGHFSGKKVIDANEMVGKIKSAVDSRSSADFLVIARTDARAPLGLDEALERARHYADAGADVTFVEAPTDAEELRRVAALPFPQVANVVIGGKSPALPAEEFARMGFALVLYANAALQGAIRGMTHALAELHREGVLAEDPKLLATFAERQELVQKNIFDQLDKRYGKTDG